MKTATEIKHKRTLPRNENRDEARVLETAFTELFFIPLSSPRRVRPLALAGVALVGLVALGATLLLGRVK